MTPARPATAPTLPEFATLVRLFEATHDELLAVLARKRVALRHARIPELLSIQPIEAKLVERLQLLVGQRDRMLRKHRESGGTATTLVDLAESLRDDPDGLRERLVRLRKLAADVQRENRIQWIIARSVLSACGGLVEVIVNQGRKSPVYRKGAGGAAGNLLDATA